MNTTSSTTSNQASWTQKMHLLLLPVMVAVGLLALQISAVQGAAGLTVEILAGYNLVVDSNVSSPSTFGPSVATVAGRFCNPATNAHTIKDVTGYIGDYKGSLPASTPGIYPARTLGNPDPEHPLLSGSGVYSYTHLGNLSDATRYIGDLAPGQCKVQYWSFTYPRCEANKTPPCNSGYDPVWGAPTVPGDDLYLYFDIWGVGKDASDQSPKIADATHKMTMRNEISAMANKIEPNPDGAWFNTDTSIVYPGDVITTNGVNYTFGNVNKGFDNNGDGVYDTNAWMQPFGVPSYDPSCFRLVRTTGTLTVTRSSGNPPLILPISDQLYFSNLPSDNTNVTGRVYYTFLALGGACQAAMTPYQEAASGADNEKFNGDFGAGIPPLLSYNTQVAVDKNGNATVAGGGTITYNIPFTNTGNTRVGLTLSSGTGVDLPFTIQDTVPSGLEYACSSASASLAYTPDPDIDDYTLLFSTDSGATWTAGQPTGCTPGGYLLSQSPGSLIKIQWRLKEPLPAKSGSGTNTSVGLATFQARLPGSYTGPVFIKNEACANLDGASTSLDCGSTYTILEGAYSIGDRLWRDENINGIQDATEAGIPNVTVWLYLDHNINGVLDAGDVKLIETVTGANGAYSFPKLPVANYLVQVNTLDADIDTGYNLTTRPVQVATITNQNIDTADFGFGPALKIDKNLISANPVFSGELVTYTIQLMNNLPGDGTENNYCQYKVFASTEHNATNGLAPSSGNTDGKRFVPQINATGSPDGQVAVSEMDSSDDILGLSGFNLAISGSITDVNLQLYVKEVENLQFDDRFELRVYRDTAFYPADALQHTYPFVGSILTRPVGSMYVLETGKLNGVWDAAVFTGNRARLQIASNSTHNSGAIGVDAVAFVVTTDQRCGGSDTTITSLPLIDRYDTDRLQFLWANPAQSSTVITATEPDNGLITWNNLGPLFAGGKITATVAFRALDPSAPISFTNSTNSTGALFGNGRAVNNANDSVIASLYRGGAINGVVFANTNVTDPQNNWQGSTGYGTGDTFIPGVTVELRACVKASTGIVIPISEVTANNLKCDGNTLSGEWRTIATQTTDTSGKYTFAGLRDGYYNVQVVGTTLPTSLTTCSLEATNQGNGAGSATCDGKWANETENLTPINFNPINPSGETITNVNFGYRSATSGVISGYVWNDRDGDGVWDPGEEPIPYVNVHACVTGTPSCTTLFAPTDATGYYEFSPILPNGATTNYTVVVTTPNGMSQSGDPDVAGPCDPSGAVPHADDCNNQTNSFALALSQVAGPFNFGYTGGDKIGDTVYADWDGDGQKAATEEGIAGITLKLYRDLNHNGILDPGEPLLDTQVTNASGVYEFTGLASGNDYDYLVILSEASIPGGYVQSGDPDQGLAACTVCDAQSAVPDLSGNNLAQDFGYKPTGNGVIGDTIWRDANGNGVQDNGETGISGVLIHLYQDQNENGLIDGEEDALVRTTTTDASGKYSFTGLYSTNYIVKVMESNFTSGQPLASLSVTNVAGNQQPVTLGVNATNNTLDFGYANSTLGGTIWSDNDGDGTQDSGELGLVGIQLILSHSTDDGVTWNTVDYQSTGADGTYQFTNLAAGQYRVEVTSSGVNSLTGYSLTYDPDAYSMDASAYPPPVCVQGSANYSLCDRQSITDLPVGRTDMTHDFGFLGPGSIGDYVWIDSDGDGVQDTGEAGYGGLTVTLDPPAGVNLGAGDGVAITTLTDSDGYYSFGGLPNSASDYLISITPPAGMAATYDADGAPNGTTSFRMTAGHVDRLGTATCSTCDLKLDFGLKYNGSYSLSGTVFLDTDQSGTAYQGAPNDAALENVTVYLYSGTRLVATTTTDSSGLYSFGGLSDGVYRVAVNALSPQLSGMTQTYEPGVSCITNPSVCRDSPTTVTISSAPVTLQDFGFFARMDCGDLPAAFNIPAGEYRTLLQNEGPCHIGPSSGAPLTYLGGAWDAEANGQPNNAAQGDDVTSSDEDGVEPVSFYAWTSGSSAQISVTITGGNAYLAAWFDWNNNRRFASPITGQYDSGEFVYFGALSAGNHQLTVNIPAGLNCCSQNRNLYARFRVFRSVSSPPPVASTGNVLDGEVEDYMWGNAPTAVTMGPLAVSVDGDRATLTWLTALEMDAFGFNVYRTAGLGGERVKLNTHLIPSQMEGQIGGALYEWLDAPLAPGYYEYWVEFIDISGSQYFGPAVALVTTNTYLPIIGR